MQQTKTLLEELKSFISDKIQESDVPGTAVAIVKDDKVIFAEGFGYRNLTSKEEVTSETVFPIASMSKSFTTAALGVLADQKKINWDEPVRKVYPEFRLMDSYATEKATLRDLASHRTGLARHELVWFSSKSITKKEITDRLAYLQPFTELRTTYQYQNMMYTTLGNVIERVTNVRWDKFVQEHLLDKMGMKSTSFLDEQRHNGNYALPYAKIKGQLKEIPFHAENEPEAAGSIKSNVLDIAQWLLLHMKQGNMNGEQILSQQEMENLHSPQIVMSEADIFPFDEMLHAAYCLGWMTRVYRGRREVHHGGNINGFTSFMSFLPQEGIGVVVLTNLNSNFYPSAITYEIYDRLLSLQPIDWVSRFNNRLQYFQELEEKAKQEIHSKQILQTTPSHSLNEYAGTYVHKGYGTVTVSVAGDQLNIQLNDMTSTTTHYHYNSFLMEIHHSCFEFVFLANFNANQDGNIHSVCLHLDGSPGVDEIKFVRQLT